jgi:hypothetical protein
MFVEESCSIAGLTECGLVEIGFETESAGIARGSGVVRFFALVFSPPICPFPTSLRETRPWAVFGGCGLDVWVENVERAVYSSGSSNVSEMLLLLLLLLLLVNEELLLLREELLDLVLFGGLAVFG